MRIARHASLWTASGAITGRFRYRGLPSIKLIQRLPERPPSNINCLVGPTTGLQEPSARRTDDLRHIAGVRFLWISSAVMVENAVPAWRRQLIAE